jgi:hypothetical protein
MEVDHDHLRLGASLLHEVVHELERADRRLHEKSSLEVHDRDRGAVGRLDHHEPSPRGGGAEVRRPHDPLGAFEVVVDLAPAPDVIAEREDVGSRREQPLRQPRRDPGAVRDVLAVDDAEARVQLLLEPRETLLDRGTARRAEDVGDEEDLQRSFLGREGGGVVHGHRNVVAGVRGEA